MQLFYMVKLVSSSKDHRYNMAATFQLIGRLMHAALHTSLILYILVMVNWQLSKQGIYWPVPCGHITASGVELIKVNFFSEGGYNHLSGTGRQLDCRLKPGYVISMRSSALIRLSLIYTLVFYFVKTILQNLAHGIHIVHNSSIVPRHARGSILPEQLGLMMMMHGCHCSLAFARVFSWQKLNFLDQINT